MRAATRVATRLGNQRLASSGAARRRLLHAARNSHATSGGASTSSASSSASVAGAIGGLLVLAGGAVWAASTNSDSLAHAAAAAAPGADVVKLNRPAPDEDEEDAFRYNSDGTCEWVSSSPKPRIVVLGTGWSSVSFLKSLDVGAYEIVVISPRNYFLFTPLLPSACTGTLEMGSLTEPIRQILLHRHQAATNQYVEAKAVGLDRDQRRVMCVDSNGRSFSITYDHLLIGVGAQNNTFNTPGVKDYAFFLKEAKHARLIRTNILDHFERASSPTTSLAEKEALLQFVVVGGGPTGVEFAGELVDFLDSDLSRQFPQLIPLVRVRLIQSQDHILNTYDQAISLYAEEKFKELRIEVITGARVQSIAERSITYQDKSTKRSITIPFGICLWSTGIQMGEFSQSVAKQLRGQESEKALVTDEYLRLLQEVPKLDRMPKRFVAEAAKVVTPAAGVSVAAATAAAAASESPCESLTTPLDVDPRVYSFGDCATTYVPKLSKRCRAIFEAADADRSGKLSYDELHELCVSVSNRVPAMSAQMSVLLAQYTRYAPGNTELSLEDFRKMLDEADRNVRTYPATAQVASQQGKYLAKRFNAFAQNQVKEKKAAVAAEKQPSVSTTGAPRPRAFHPPINVDLHDPYDAVSKPFRYRHLGSLAYIGGETAAIDLGDGGSYTGTAAFWLWKSAYLNEAVSMRTKLNLAWDWFKTAVFGRDTSKP